jgi:hypothetical protein
VGIGKRGIAVALAASLAMLLLPACVPAVAMNVGVAPSPSGTARVLFVHCDDLGVTGVSLQTYGVPGAAARPPLWRIETTEPSPATVFTVGRAPFGFEQSVPLRRTLPAGKRLFAEVETTAGRYAVGFHALDLAPGLVVRAADAVPKESFATGACG